MREACEIQLTEPHALASSATLSASDAHWQKAVGLLARRSSESPRRPPP